MKKYRLAIISTGSVLLLGIFLATTDLKEMWLALKNANYIFIFPGILTYFIAVGLRAVRWRLLLSPIKPIPSKKLFPIVVVGYMANNILPFRIGEVIRSYFLHQKTSVNTASGLSSILVERIIDALTLLLIIGIAGLFVPLSQTLSGFSQLTGIGEKFIVGILLFTFLGLFLVMVLISFFHQVAQTIIAKVFSIFPVPLRLKLQVLSTRFFEGLNSLNDWKIILKAFAISVPIWMFEAGLFFFVSLSLGLNEAFSNQLYAISASILVTGISNIGSSIPSAPGGIGLFELITRETLVLMPGGNVLRPDAAAFAAIAHFCLLFPIILLGQLFLWMEGISLDKIYQPTKGPISQ